MNKKLLIGSGALFALAVVVAFSDSLMNRRDERLGKPVVQGASLVGMDSIRFSKKDKEMLLVTDKESVWRIGSESGFPADAAKISRLIDDLTRSDVQMLVSSSKEPALEFGIADAAEITLRKGTSDLLRVKIGGSRDRGGQYISFANDPKVYLINQNLDGSPEEGAWELKRLLNIQANQIKKVEFKPAPNLNKKPVTLVRDKVEDPIKVEKLTSGGKESSSIRTHEGILSGLDFVTKHGSVSADAKKALEKSTRVTVSLFDGRIFDVRIGSKGDSQKNYFMSITATKGHNTAESDVKEIDWINSMMSTHAFEISSMVASRFEKGLDDMLEKKGS